MIGKTFNEFDVSCQIISAWRTIYETDVVNFIQAIGFNEPLFLDKEFVKTRSLYDRPIVPGALTFVLAEGLTAQTGIIHGTGLALVAVENLTFSKPVYIGDSIRCSIRVVSKKSIPARDGGIVAFHHDVITRESGSVMQYRVSRFITQAAFMDGGEI